MTKATYTKTLHEGSKAATLLEMLQRQDGATVDEMTKRTGWEAQSVRAAMTGLRKKGHVIDKRVADCRCMWARLSIPFGTRSIGA